MLLEIDQIITTFVLAHRFLVFYLMGSLVAVGIVYTLTSSDCLNPLNRRWTYIVSAISSWIVVLAFLYGFLRGFFGGLSGKNDKDGGGN